MQDASSPAIADGLTAQNRTFCCPPPNHRKCAGSTLKLLHELGSRATDVSTMDRCETRAAPTQRPVGVARGAIEYQPGRVAHLPAPRVAALIPSPTEPLTKKERREG